MAGLAYRSVPVDLLKEEQKSPAHLRRNPLGRVPVLEIDGVQLTQSLAMLDYLDTTRAMGLLPKDPVARARQQALAHAIAIDVQPVCNSSVAAYASELTRGREGVRQNWMNRFIRPGLVAFEKMLGDFAQFPYCCGDKPGLADVCLVPQVYNAERWGILLDDLPGINRVASVCKDHPAFVAAHPDACRPKG